mmetsp:Transcript_26831/g.45261  ORF Transcript_26831/g.45261 Transcript_26831/m.45261 type:complete len:99 (-) Transcript_26831:328-624(-)
MSHLHLHTLLLKCTKQHITLARKRSGLTIATTDYTLSACQQLLLCKTRKCLLGSDNLRGQDFHGVWHPLRAQPTAAASSDRGAPAPVSRQCHPDPTSS